jgi:hypothetical protein
MKTHILKSLLFFSLIAALVILNSSIASAQIVNLSGPADYTVKKQTLPTPPSFMSANPLLEFNSITWGTKENGKIIWQKSEYKKSRFYINSDQKYIREYYFEKDALFADKYIEKYVSYDIVSATISNGIITFMVIRSNHYNQPEIKVIWNRTQNKLTIYWGIQGDIDGHLWDTKNDFAKYENL